MRVTGTPFWSQACGWGAMASAFWPSLYPGVRSGTAQKRNLGSPSRRLTTCRRGHRSWVQCVISGSQRQGPQWSDPWLQKRVRGTLNVTSQMGKEPQLMCEVERFWLDIVILTLTHGKGPWTSLLKKTLFHSGVTDSERRLAKVVIHVVPQLSAGTLEFISVSKKIASLHLWERGQILTVVCAYHPNSSSS